jgi:hypothetical protein
MRASDHAFLAALEAGGPAADRVYAWLIGSWDLDVIGHLPDGSSRRRPGEWHFGWVLEGRAIQDVFIVPRRGPARSGDAAGNVTVYDTTLRTYDPGCDAWRIQSADPVAESFFKMIGRARDADIPPREGHRLRLPAARRSLLRLSLLRLSLLRLSLLRLSPCEPKRECAVDAAPA